MKICRMKSLFGALAVAAYTFPMGVMAALPGADDVAPTGVDTDKPNETLEGLFTVGITIGGTILAAVIVLGSMYQIYNKYVEYNESPKGNLKELVVTAVIGVILIIAGVIMAGLAISYGTFD